MRYPSLVQAPNNGPEWMEREFVQTGVDGNDIPLFQRQADLPSDPALDQRLREILQQARLVTAASGAVIALARGDKMVCRATLGEKAPSTGVRLNTRSGLSGACVQTRELQLCDDTLADPRVNAVACSDLGIRSIVVLPVLDGGELWGILELFSSTPHAFSESDLQALQGLSRKISSTVHEAIAGGSTAVAAKSFSQPPISDPVPAASVPSALPNPAADAAAGGRDYRTGVLSAAVLALAVLLGWMVGRVGWSMAVNRAPSQIPVMSEKAPTTSEAHAAPPRPEEVPTLAIPLASRPVPLAAVKPVLKPKAAAPELNGGLVVYEHGKVVFRMSPSGRESSSPAEPSVMPSGAILEAATRENDGSSIPASRSSGNNYLLERVDPQYPEAARQQHIQGPVLLNVLVGPGGLVREASVISGDPQLAKAAIDAVRQWRFNPHHLNGKAVEFETRITVNFALPE
jgi:TonB family protein